MNQTSDAGQAELGFDSGDIAWMLMSTSLVLLMTMPGLCLYYAGMLTEKGVLYNTFLIVSICCLITVEWFMIGYSLSFGPVSPLQHEFPVFGDGSRIWLRGMTLNCAYQLAPTIPEPLFCAFELTFAIIAPSLMCGSFADRMKFFPMVIFIFLWHLAVYCPLAHMNWHPDGFLNKFGVLDFAGGNVVHISSGISGLVSSFVVGNRTGWKPKASDSHRPHNILITIMGMCLLWVGWFGFIAGSTFSAGSKAASALLSTQICSATAALTWLATETYFRKKTSVLGMCGGVISGLVCMTPAAGYVDMNGAFWLGFIAGPLCYFGSQLKHHVLKIDDALDAFGAHAVGGIIGGIGVGLFSTDEITGNPEWNGIFYSHFHYCPQLARQAFGVAFSVVWSGAISMVLLVAIDKVLGLRVSEEDELELDVRTVRSKSRSRDLYLEVEEEQEKLLKG